MRLHWIGTISGRAPPPDALPCTAPASKRGQGRWVVREEERGEVICCGQGTEQRGKEREANNQQCTRKMHKNSHQQTLMLQQCTATYQQLWRGKACSKRAQRGRKVTRGARLHGKRRGMGRHTARGCGSRDEHVGRCWCQLTAPHCTGHRAHRHAEQASERSGNVSRRRRKSSMGECG